MDKQYPERIKDGPQTMLDKLNNTASGYGIVKFHKEQQKSPLRAGQSTKRWVQTFHIQNARLANHCFRDQQYNRKPIGYLPEIRMKHRIYCPVSKETSVNWFTLEE